MPFMGCCVLFDALGHDLVGAVLVCLYPRTTLLGLTHLVQEPLAACIGVVTSGLRSSIPLDVSTLLAVPVVVVVLAQIGDIDAELPELSWPHLIDRRPLHRSRLIESRSGALLPGCSGQRLHFGQLLRVPALGLRPPRH